MIDIHSHILPGVDDGASSMKESLHMLSMARRQGITDVFATSHYSKAFPNRDPEKLRRLRDELMSRANRPVQGPEGKVKCKRPIRIWTGQEIFYSNSVIRLLEEGKLLTLADSNYVLVEFMPSVPYSEICTAVRNLSRAGYTPGKIWLCISIIFNSSFYTMKETPGIKNLSCRASLFRRILLPLILN